jgi:outer membrane protein assembly factor BamB
MLCQRKLILSLTLFAASASAGPLVYVVTFAGQFGSADATTGAFTQIGATTSDPLGGLVSGPNGSLLGVSYGGNLDSVNPATGAVSVIGFTGLGPALATAPLATGVFNGTVYETDGSNNLYTINTTTGAASLLGATGLPQCPSVTDPDDIADEAIFAAGGKLYITFDGFNFITNAVVDAPELYQINPATGAAALIGPTAFGLDAALQVNGTVYGFTAANTVLSLNVANGSTSFVTNYDSNALDITGAAATPEPASFGLAALGIAAILVARWQRRHSRRCLR